MSEQDLPNKEASLFKNVVKFYEEKQYKKGLKEAEKILRQAKFKDHGETLAMKGLILNCMDRKEEAYTFTKRGLMMNMRSHVCWHVYGLLHRSDRDYDQAIKSYLNALRIDPENMQILRDLSLLQIQRRELPGFLETRRKLLNLKSNQRNNWIGLALSHHLLGHFSEAEKVLDVYEDTEGKEATGANEEYEKSEMLLYKNMIIHEGGDLQKALDHLDAIEPNVVDGLALQQDRASLLLQLDRFEEAETRYRELLDANPDNYEYHAGLQCAVCKLKEKPGGWDDGQLATLAALYEELNAKPGWEKFYGVQRMALNFATGPTFAAKLTEYVKRYLRRGIPSLFTDLKALYDDEEKVGIIETVFVGILASLESSSTFPNEENWEPPTVMVWVLNFLTQHNSKLRRVPMALELIERAIAHTPTIVELYLAKARAQKRGGDLKGASETSDYARKLDTQDRYLNSKCSLYQLRADNTTEADKCMSLFTKDGDNPNNLFDMQCMWFELECGRSFYRQQEYGKALKKFTAIDKHFTDWIDDQFDFHTYCLRKMTLRAYVRLLRLEDRIQSHKYFEGAAQGIIQCYIDLHDKPALSEGNPAAADEFSHLDEKERKKALSKKRKAEAKVKAQAEQEEKKGGKAGKEEKKDKKPADEDPDGVKLAKAEAPLEEARKFLKTLQMFCGDKIETHIAAFKVYHRLGKHLLMVQAIKRAAKIDGANPDLHECIATFANEFPTAALSESIKKIVEDQASTILKGQKLGQYNAQYIATHGSSLPHRIAGARTMMMLSSDNLEKMSGLLTSDLPIIGPLSPGNQLCSLCMCLQGRVPTKIVLASDLNACSPSPPLAVRSHNRGTRGASRACIDAFETCKGFKADDAGVPRAHFPISN